MSTIAALVLINETQTSRIVVPDCPLAPPSRRTTYVRALHRACTILDGVAPLAAHLDVAESSVRTWLDGVEEPPESAFLSVVEIILLDATAGRSRPT